jgi:hexosaminidase
MLGTDNPSSPHMLPGPRRTLTLKRVALLSIIALVACTQGPSEAEVASARAAMAGLLPQCASVTPADGVFQLGPSTVIAIDAGDPSLAAVAEALAAALRPATGYALPISTAAGSDASRIRLSTAGADPSIGEEGYTLVATPDAVEITARSAAGAFYGVQTLRQLLPVAIESNQQSEGPFLVAAGTIVDRPRYAHRGVMLDVARHFFSVDDVKRLIDLVARYKINRLHLHLSDDQGFRIAIDSWPDLARIGGATQVGGGAGGYYTQEQYRDLVAFAAERFMTVIPEIDMPGHCNAALNAYASLNCDGVAPPPYTDTSVGVSTLCVGDPDTARFVDDVIREMAALTPGDLVHVGGDESFKTAPADYVQFIQAAEQSVISRGKRMAGWEEVSKAGISASAVIQLWLGSLAAGRVAPGTQIILSPARRAYLDMKYDPATPVGQSWIGYVDVDQAYDWDPDTEFPLPPGAEVIGVEAALWTETVATVAQMDLMIFPRAIGHAELGWSPAATHDWENYRRRLAAHAPRLDALGVAFYRSTVVDWPAPH